MGHGGGGGKADFVLAPPTLSEKRALKPRLPAKVKTVLGHGEAKIIRKERIGHCADRMTGHRDAGPERTHSGCPQGLGLGGLSVYLHPEPKRSE